MNTKPPSRQQSKGFSPELVERLSKLNPTDRSKVIETASKLLAIRARREATGSGTVDLTTYEKGAGADTTTDTARDDLKGDTARLEPGNDSVRMSLTPEHVLDEGKRQQ